MMTMISTVMMMRIGNNEKSGWKSEEWGRRSQFWMSSDEKLDQHCVCDIQLEQLQGHQNPKNKQ